VEENEMSIKRGYIDARKIDSKFVTDRNDKRFLNFSIIPTDKSQWDEAVVIQDCGKDELGNYIKGPIIGGIRKPRERTEVAGKIKRPDDKPKADYEAPQDDVPF
jgi:hypothetical protein